VFMAAIHRFAAKDQAQGHQSSARPHTTSSRPRSRKRAEPDYWIIGWGRRQQRDGALRHDHVASAISGTSGATRGDLLPRFHSTEVPFEVPF
jgi:hypothetical protein